MALPHLPTAYTSRKNIHQAALVQKRARENDFREKWNNNAHYFQRSGVTATQQNAWESNASFNSSMEAWKCEQEKENKAAELKRRRLKLTEMLKQEREQLQAELSGLSKDNISRLEEMKYRTDEIKSAREEKRKKDADDRLYEHWRVNNPDIRRLEEEQHKKHVISRWSDQLDEQREREERERQEREELEKEMEEERLLALELERRKEEERLEEEKNLQDVLKRQVGELRRREVEAISLKNQEELLMREEWELEKLEEHRKQTEKERKKLEFGKVLLRQHSAALKRRSRQIQEELEQDRIFLEQLAEQESEERVVLTTRREKAKADAAWMKEVIEEQIRVEKTREAEIDMFYQDEAARQWDKKESEWARERLARERLMKEVLEGRQDQVRSNMEEVRKQQEESLRRREMLLRELEFANEETRREKVMEEEAKTARKQELESQITARREKNEDLRLKLDEELEDEKLAVQDYDELLNREARRLNIRGYQEKDYSRKQAWM